MARKKDVKSLYDKVVEGLSDKKSVPDYKTMCQILEEPNYDKLKSPTKKKKQLKYWKLCFKWKTQKGAFTGIQVYSEDEYYFNMLKYLSSEATIYSFYAFLALYNKFSDGAICYITKADLATALCFCNEEFKKFQRDKVSYGEVLENYTMNLQDSKYEFAKLPKKEIKENWESDSDNTITPRTYHIVNDYNLHVSENNNYLIESLLKEVNNNKLAINRETFIGGFVDMSKIPIDADLSDIYQANGCFYLRIKNDNPLLVQYKERALVPEEINLYSKLQNEVIHSMGYEDFFQIKLANRVQDLQDRLLPILFQRMKVLFVYQACEIFDGSILLENKKEKYKEQINQFLDINKLKNSLLENNKVNQKKILELKKERQKKNSTVITRNKFIKKSGETIYSLDKDKHQDELNKQYDLFMYEKLNKELIQVDVERFFNYLDSLDDLSKCPQLWLNLFKKSLNKAENGKDMISKSYYP